MHTLLKGVCLFLLALPALLFAHKAPAPESEEDWLDRQW